MTTLTLEPESITWTLILICVLLGLLLLAVIVTILYKVNLESTIQVLDSSNFAKLFHWSGHKTDTWLKTG